MWGQARGGNNLMNLSQPHEVNFAKLFLSLVLRKWAQWRKVTCPCLAHPHCPPHFALLCVHFLPSASHCRSPEGMCASLRSIHPVSVCFPPSLVETGSCQSFIKGFISSIKWAQSFYIVPSNAAQQVRWADCLQYTVLSVLAFTW